MLFLDPGQNLSETLVLGDGGVTDALQLVEGGVRQRPAFLANLQPPIRKIIDIDHFAAKANRYVLGLKRQLQTTVDQTKHPIAQMVHRSRSPGRSRHPKEPAGFCYRKVKPEAKPGRSSSSVARAWSTSSPKAAGGSMMWSPV